MKTRAKGRERDDSAEVSNKTQVGPESSIADQAAITIDRIQSEQALRRSHQQLAGILESAMDAIISVDVNRKIALFNRAAEKMFQCSASDAIGDTLNRFIPERFRSAHDGHIRRFGETGETNRKMGKLGTVYGLRANGEEFPIEASISQMESAGQKLYTVIVRDITRRVREEEMLRRQVELLHLSHDAIFVWNAVSGIEFWSEGAAQLYGYEPDEVRGLLPESLFERNFPTPWLEIKAELQEHALWEGELHRQTKSNSEVFVSCRLQLVSETGTARVILETDRDITERRRLEQELLEASSAEQRRIGQDLHDGLCQYLAGIEFRVSALMDQLAESPEIQREIANIGGLIRDGARQARMLSRGLSPVSLEVGGLISALKELTENTARLFNKTCHFECPLPVSIHDNRVATHLYRIAQEAISNAARHGHARTIVVALDKTADEVTLRITDDGGGLPPAAARPDGMGLRIMKYRAEMLGALLTIDTTKGSGTSVVCTLRIQ
jgi:PAS domain S-box-containing protein